MKTNEEVDVTRTNRQDKAINEQWAQKYKGQGVIEACTGFGKTRMGMEAARKRLKSNPNALIFVVVPSKPIYNQWQEKINEEGLQTNVFPVIVNTYVNARMRDCDLLICDEVHRYLSTKAKYFSRVLNITRRKFMLGLTATLSPEEKEYLIELGIPIVDTITRNEAEANGWVAPSLKYKYMINLTPELQQEYDEINEQFYRYFGYFQVNNVSQFELAMACAAAASKESTVRIAGPLPIKWPPMTNAEIREQYAKECGWDGTDPNDEWSPKNIQLKALQFVRAMQRRTKFLYDNDAKIKPVVDIVNYYSNKHIIVFSEHTILLDKTKEALGDIAVLYHINLKSEYRYIDGKKKKISKKALLQEALEKFEDPNSGVRVLLVSKAMDEGYDYDKIGVAIQQSYSSKKRRSVQRQGRSGRKDYSDLEKVSIFISLCLKGTQEEKWFNSATEQRDNNIFTVDDVEQLYKF